MGSSRLIYLLWVLELPPEFIIHLAVHSIRVTCHSLHIHFQASLQQMIHLTIIIIIISIRRQKNLKKQFKSKFWTTNFCKHTLQLSLPDSINALNIMPYSFTQFECIHSLMRGNCVICQVVSYLELVIQNLPHLWAQPVKQRITMTFPCVVLQKKKGDLEHIGLQNIVSRGWFTNLYLLTFVSCDLFSGDNYFLYVNLL